MYESVEELSIDKNTEASSYAALTLDEFFNISINRNIFKGCAKSELVII